MTSKAEAVEALIDLGLSEYEARVFVALTQLSEGTANEISQIADVPQSRVYDVTDQLQQRGLIDVQESEPRRYFALPVERAITTLRETYDASLEAAESNLQTLESRVSDGEGVWEILSQRGISNRVTMHIENAEAEVYLLIGEEDLLEQEVIDSLVAAVDEGVTVYAEVPTSEAKARLHDAVPECRVTVTELDLGAFEGREPGRLLMVDRETILMSALTEGLVPDDTEETGLWGTELGHGLVAWLRSLLDDRRGRLTFETATGS